MARVRVRRLVAEPVPALAGHGPDVVRALAALAGRRRLAAFSGRWSDDAPLLVTADPVHVREEAHGDPGAEVFDVLDRPVPLDPATSAPAGAVGGGWVTLLGHDLGRRTGRVRTTPPAVTGPRLPTVSLAFADHVLRLDGRRWWAEALDPGDGSAVEAARGLARLALEGLAAGAGPDATGGDTTGTAATGTAATRAGAAALATDVGAPDARRHMLAVEEVVHAVRAGDIAQANVCSRFGLRLADGGPAAVEAWLALVAALRPDRAALVTGPWGALVGASPEQYLGLDGDRVSSAPIKGTRPAGDGEALRASAKDLGENVMIVDLVRNDLSRVCRPGSVGVDGLLHLERHAGVEHLVSRVTGRLRPGTGAGAVVAATFPPGSVTGTPKQRATEVTDLVEGAARGAHTGAVGLLGPRLAQLAVTIRSLEVAADGTAALGVGGGVVADSTPAEEWHEVLTKAAPLLTALGAVPPDPDPTTAGHKGLADPGAGLLETLLAVDGLPLEPADHLGRLRRSYWETTGRALDDEAPDLERRVADAARRAGRGHHRVRLRCRTDRPSAAAVTVPRVAVATESLVPTPPVSRQPGLVLAVVAAPAVGLERHKHADRRWLEAAHARARDLDPGCDDAVLADGSGALLETTRDCLLAVHRGADGRPVLRTPACDGRVLPGVTRQVLLDLAAEAGWRLERAPLDARTLERAEGLVAANALRGVRWVRRAGRHTWGAPSSGALALDDLLRRRRRLPAG